VYESAENRSLERPENDIPDGSMFETKSSIRRDESDRNFVGL
jgi:hypothetical protein